MRPPRRIPIFALALVAGCAYSGVDPDEDAVVEVGLDQPFILAPGETARAAGTPLHVTFVAVASDSRCPEDVTCVWEGDAAVRVETVVDGEARSHTLHTSVRTDERPGSVERAGYRVALEGVTPGPRTDRAIPPADYRVTLRITRAE